MHRQLLAVGKSWSGKQKQSMSPKWLQLSAFKICHLCRTIVDSSICCPNGPSSQWKSRSPTAASVPLNEPRPPLPDWSWRGRAWPIYFREARGSHEAARHGWPAGLAASAHSWGWAVSEASCLSGLGYGYNESRLGDGDGVAAGGGAKPSPASGVREEHQLY